MSLKWWMTNQEHIFGLGIIRRRRRRIYVSLTRARIFPPSTLGQPGDFGLRSYFDGFKWSDFKARPTHFKSNFVGHSDGLPHLLVRLFLLLHIKCIHDQLI